MLRHQRNDETRWNHQVDVYPGSGHEGISIIRDRCQDAWQVMLPVCLIITLQTRCCQAQSLSCYLNQGPVQGRANDASSIAASNVAYFTGSC